MKDLLKSRGFWMGNFACAWVLIFAYVIGKIDVGLATVCVGTVALLFGIKQLGTEVKKTIRTSKGITYDENLQAEVYVESANEIKSRKK